MFHESIGYIFSLAKKSLRLRSVEPEALSPRGDLWSALAGGGSDRALTGMVWLTCQPEWYSLELKLHT